MHETLLEFTFIFPFMLVNVLRPISEPELAERGPTNTINILNTDILK